jgi:hypothetical protein
MKIRNERCVNEKRCRIARKYVSEVDEGNVSVKELWDCDGRKNTEVLVERPRKLQHLESHFIFNSISHKTKPKHGTSIHGFGCLQEPTFSIFMEILKRILAQATKKCLSFLVHV